MLLSWSAMFLNPGEAQLKILMVQPPFFFPNMWLCLKRRYPKIQWLLVVHDFLTMASRGYTRCSYMFIQSHVQTDFIRKLSRCCCNDQPVRDQTQTHLRAFRFLTWAELHIKGHKSSMWLHITIYNNNTQCKYIHHSSLVSNRSRYNQVVEYIHAWMLPGDRKSSNR